MTIKIILFICYFCLDTKLESMKKYDNGDKALNKAINDSILLFNKI